MKQNKDLIALAGEHYVCEELCRNNILALITPKNNPLFDIVASDPSGEKAAYIQVKTMGIENKQGWKLGKSITQFHQNPNLFVVLVNLKEDQSNDFYIYPHDDLATRVQEVYQDYIETPKRDGSKKKEVGFRWFDLKDFTESDKSRKSDWEALGLF